MDMRPKRGGEVLSLRDVQFRAGLIFLTKHNESKCFFAITVMVGKLPSMLAKVHRVQKGKHKLQSIFFLSEVPYLIKFDLQMQSQNPGE